MENDPLSGVTVFVMAARVGSFTLAAERLGLTKSAVGKSIARLEKKLQTQLFQRTTRISRLTADGEAYLSACTLALEAVTSAQSSLLSSDHILSGKFHVDMPVFFGRKILLPIFADIAKKNPDLHLVMSFSDSTTDLVQEDVDLAIRFGKLKNSSNLMARKLIAQNRVICASPEYLVTHGKPENPSDLSHHRCIVGRTKGPPHVWYLQIDDSEHRLSLPKAHHFSDGEAMVDAARAGLGLCQVPEFMVQAYLDNGTLIPVMCEFAPSAVEVHAIWPRQTNLNSKVRCIVDRLVREATEGNLTSSESR